MRLQKYSPEKFSYAPIIFSVSGREFGTALAEVNAKNYR